MRSVRWAGVGSSVASLWVLTGCFGAGSGGGTAGWSITLPPWECTPSETWLAQGLSAEHFPSVDARELLTATLRRGSRVPLRLTTLASSNCEAAVAKVDWRSSAPDVLTVAATGPGPMLAEMHAVGVGEGRVWATVVLGDGRALTAELYAVPGTDSPMLRVYAVRVVR